MASLGTLPSQNFDLSHVVFLRNKAQTKVKVFIFPYEQANLLKIPFLHHDLYLQKPRNCKNLPQLLQINNFPFEKSVHL